jgi:hypothetical protein
VDYTLRYCMTTVLLLDCSGGKGRAGRRGVVCIHKLTNVKYRVQRPRILIKDLSFLTNGEPTDTEGTSKKEK